jgi:PAS domain S-box-containing protein
MRRAITRVLPAVFSVLFGLGVAARAQTSAPAFERISVDDGLSQSYVTALAQDHQGFVWVGTHDGLNRYDGYGFTTYRFRPNDPETLSDNRVTALAVDSGGRLFVGTAAGGLNVYDPRTDAFRRVDLNARGATAGSGRAVGLVYADRSGRVWVCSDSGTGWLDADTAAFHRVEGLADNVAASSPVRAIGEDPSGHLLFGTTSGLFLFDHGSFTSVTLRLDGAPVRSGSVHRIAHDAAGRVIVAARAGVFRLDVIGGAPRPATEGGAIEVDAARVASAPLPAAQALEAVGDATFWMGTYDGLLAVDGSGPSPGRLEAGAGADRISGGVTCLLRDRADTMWVGTNGAGLYKLSRARMRFAHLVPDGNRSMRAIEQDADGGLWIAGYEGLFRYDEISGRLTRADAFATGAAVRTVYQDPASRSRLWIGTETDGLFSYDRTANRVAWRSTDTSGERSSAPDSRLVLCLHRASDGRLWVGTGGGVFELDERERRLRPGPAVPGPGPEPNIVYSITELRRHPGWLWIGTQSGLFVAAPTGRVTRYASDPRDTASLSHDIVYHVTEDHAGTVWVGTAAGLNRVELRGDAPLPARFSRVTTDNGLPNDCVYSVLEDDAHRLWLSTNQGISRFDPAKGGFWNFTRADGLQSNEFNSGARLRARDGRMFLGGLNGVTVFSPGAIVESAFAPPVVLTGFQAFNRPITGRHRAPFLTEEITVAREVRLSYADRVVSFEFVTLSYTSPGRSRYACMMQGWDDRWLELGTERRATYTNLPPGTYTFLVKGTNGDGVWNPVPTSIRVVVVPPFWHVWWFRLLVLSLLVAAVYAAHAVRTRGIRRHNLALKAEVDQRRQTEAALRVAEAKYRRIFEVLPAGIFQSTLDGRYLSANPALATILGYASAEELQEMVGQIPAQVYADPNDRDRLIERLRHESEVRDFGCLLTRKDGSSVPVVMTVRMLPAEPGDEPHLEGIVEDVTERRKLEERLLQAQKMESVGRLAGGVAHDFNNMLTVIEGYTERAIEQTQGTLLADDLSHVRKAAETAQRLTAQLLAFARRQIIQPVVVSPNRLIRDIEPLIRQLVGEDVTLRLDLADDVGPVTIDPTQCEQVLVNLAANARDAMPAGGVLQIETRAVSLTEEEGRLHDGARPGCYALVTVSDTDAGIDPEALSQIFEPFFTTKAAGRGTGLGLATVYGIIKQHDGHVSVYSEPGRGTTFRIYLPVTPGSETTVAAPPHAHETRGRELILVVEDEYLVRQFAATALRGAGYTVIEAADGPSALDLVATVRPDLLVTDVVMPKMSGRELAVALNERHPGMAVLYTSGHTRNIIAHRGILDPGVAFLQKPYSPRELAARVREILDGRGR